MLTKFQNFDKITEFLQNYIAFKKIQNIEEEKIQNCFKITDFFYKIT